MKKILVIFILSGFIKLVIGQNLVPNPSFEDTLGCPSVPGEIDKAIGWTTFCASPDYFNICYSADPYNVGIPFNMGGCQYPSSGNAYIGFATYSTYFPNAREFPACNLSSPMNLGIKYFISFKVALALTSYSQLNCASNKIGAMFTTGIYACNALITNNPPVYTNSVVTDTLNWTTISGSFIADSSYTHLVIGNFFDDANTDTLKFFSDFVDNAYYFLDDVCVSTDSLFAATWTGIDATHAQTSIKIYPNPTCASSILEFSNPKNECHSLKIFNHQGQLIKIITDIYSDKFVIERNNLPAGLYFLQLWTEKQIIGTGRLIFE